MSPLRSLAAAPAGSAASDAPIWAPKTARRLQLLSDPITLPTLKRWNRLILQHSFPWGCPAPPHRRSCKVAVRHWARLTRPRHHRRAARLRAAPARGGGAQRRALCGRIHAGGDGRRTAREYGGRVRVVPATPSAMRTSPPLLGRIASGGGWRGGPAVRRAGATVPKESRFSPVFALSADCGGILPPVAGPSCLRALLSPRNT